MLGEQLQRRDWKQKGGIPSGAQDSLGEMWLGTRQVLRTPPVNRRDWNPCLRRWLGGRDQTAQARCPAH